MDGVVILGTVHPEDDSALVDGTLGDELNQAQPDAAHVAVLNLASGIDDNPMVVVGCSSITSTQLQDMSNGTRKELDRHSDLEVKTTLNDHERVVKKELKRKRSSIGGDLASKDKAALHKECRRELQLLFEYYKEVSAHKLELGEGGHSSINSMVSCLLEESKLPFSKLVEEIYDKLKEKEGATLALVRSSVLFVGQRSMYGISNADVDVLEDESERTLWCWETRDWKLLPANQRRFLSIRRTARKKIHERISVISLTLSTLATQGLGSQKHDQLKASVKLGKVLNIEGIRLLVGKLKEKSGAELAEKEAKLKEKELMKEFDRNKRHAEKEKKKIEREIQKEKLQNEKELKRIREEAERETKRQEKEEAKRREKEEAELKKQLKKQQEEVEREQKRREKEEAELKKQAVLQKQANMMERFLKSTKSNKIPDILESGASSMGLTADSSCKGEVANAVTSAMDHILSQQDNCPLEDLWRLHVAGWHKLYCHNRSHGWGVRHTTRSQVVKEIKLQKPAEAGPNEEFVTPNGEMSCHKMYQGSKASFEKLDDDLQLSLVNDMPCHAEHVAARGPARLVKKKLLQFAKSYRPAYYGTWSKKSDIIGPRHPFKKDPKLDYEIDSDDEWEEEEPGESLSDCDKENEENIDEEDSKIADEEESEDSFVVPDGYLSENEGVQVGSCLDCKEDEASSSPCHADAEIEEFRALMCQQKTLYNLTEQALRKGQPLVISNLNHKKAELLIAEDLSGLTKLEQLCLQALCMRFFTGVSIVDVVVDDHPLMDDWQNCQSNGKSSSTHTTTPAIHDSDLPKIVRLIRSCPHGLNKVVDLLHQNFHNFSKLQLRNKVREISDFVDNRWQVKKEVLDKLGLSISPEKGGTPRGISMYFSKRCVPLPGGGESLNSCEASPQPLKPKAHLAGGDDHIMHEAKMHPPSFSEC